MTGYRRRLLKIAAFFDRFLMENKATLFIRLPDNILIAPPSNVVADNGTDSNIATVKENENIIITDSQNGALNVPIDFSDAREYVFFFEDSVEEYTLLVVGEAKVVNQVISTLLQILPWIIVSIVCISLLAAFFYSNYITKPIVAISALSKKCLIWNWIVSVMKAAMMKSGYWHIA